MGGGEKQRVPGLEGQGPSATSAPSAERREPSLGCRRWAGEGACMASASQHAASLLGSFRQDHGQGRAEPYLPLHPQGRHEQMLTDWRMNEPLWLESLYQEAGLEAGVSVSPNGRPEPNVSKLEFAQGGAMGITIMTAVTTTV